MGSYEADEAEKIAQRIVDSHYFPDLAATIRALADSRARAAAEAMRTAAAAYMDRCGAIIRPNATRAVAIRGLPLPPAKTEGA